MPGKPAANEVEPGSTDELARILLLWMRYNGVPQGALVHDLTALGMTSSRVAQLLGVESGSVRAQKSQKRPKWPRE